MSVFGEEGYCTITVWAQLRTRGQDFPGYRANSREAQTAKTAEGCVIDMERQDHPSSSEGLMKTS